MRPRVKICCISSLEEAQLAIEFGADAIGLVGPMPSGPGVISDELIREIAARVSQDVDTFLLTSDTSAEEVVAHYKRVKTRTIQLVDKLENGTLHDLRCALPGIKLVQVIHVTGEDSADVALEASESADMILLDSGNPNLLTKELGGTGRTHNWKVSRRIVEQSEKPVFLAGGLDPGNVRDAVEFVRPFGVDLCSGVRTGGKLDRSKVEKFFGQVNA